MQVYDSEMKVLNVLWRNGELSAGEIKDILAEEEGWKRTTSYTVIKKCVDKGYIERSEPGFLCKPILTKEEAQMGNVSEQIEKAYHSKTDFFKAYLSRENLTDAEIQDLFQVVERLKK